VASRPTRARASVAGTTDHPSKRRTARRQRARSVEEHLTVSRSRAGAIDNENDRTITQLTIIASSFVVASGASGSGSVAPDGDNASPQLIQHGHGPGGPPASVDRSFEYGSAELIQLGHGPRRPVKGTARLVTIVKPA
jgi:hypothetical protein